MTASKLKVKGDDILPLHFITFFQNQIKRLFIDYLTRDNWISMINYLLKNYEKNKQCLVLSFILILKNLKKIIEREYNEDWNLIVEPREEMKERIFFEDIVLGISDLYKEERYRLILSSPYERGESS